MRPINKIDEIARLMVQSTQLYEHWAKQQGINYNIGCESYTDNSNNYSYLRNFTNLCTDDAVGCELMVITGNHCDF